jgi:hypothetical protein
VDVTGWLSRITLDIIGEGKCYLVFIAAIALKYLLAGFGFQFSSLDNVKTQLHEQYENLL